MVVGSFLYLIDRDFFMTSSSHLPANSSATAFSPPEEESFNYRQVLAIARRRAWLIIFGAILVTGGIWIRSLNEPPRYRSGFQLLVEPIAGDQEFKKLSQELGELSGSGSARGGGLDYPTQIQVLRSSQVMLPIFEQLKEDYPNLSYGQLVGNLRVQRVGETKILQVSYQSGNPQLAGAVTETVAEEYISYSEKQQQTAERRVLDLIDEQIPKLKARVDSIQEEIQAFRNKNQVIDPVSKGNLLSGNLTNLEQRQQETEIQIEEKVSLRENLLDQLGLGLEDAMTTVALSEAPRYQELLNQLKEIETEIALELGRFKESSPNIQALEEQRESVLELLREESLAVLGEAGVSEEIRSQVSSPNPIRLSLTQDLINATNQIRVLRVRQNALEQAEEEVRRNLKEMTELAKEYEEINQGLEISRENVKRFIDRREQLKIQTVQTTLPWQLLEEPNPPNRPISGNSKGLIFGVVVGVLAGAGLAYLAEKIDNKFHSPDDIKEVTKLPLLGVIPFSKALQERKKRQANNEEVLPIYSEIESEESAPPQPNGNGKKGKAAMLENISFAFGEAFRTLHANLSFMNPDRPVKSLVVGSCVPGEGKSTTSLNLAIAAASIGKRVLLVDADMRRPQLHQVLEVPNQYGLSNVISTGLSLEEAMVRLSINSNLYVITSGPTPPDSNSLLSSEKMKELAQEWENQFDLVIYDSPPLGGLADAKILTSLTSGLIMVVGLGVLDRTMFKDVIETLQMSRTTVLGIVANGRQESSMGEYYYYYYYYHNHYYRPSASSQNSLNSSVTKPTSEE